MTLGIVINSNDAKTVWNAFRLGKGVGAGSLDTARFAVSATMQGLYDLTRESDRVLTF